MEKLFKSGDSFNCDRNHTIFISTSPAAVHWKSIRNDCFNEYAPWNDCRGSKSRTGKYFKEPKEQKIILIELYKAYCISIGRTRCFMAAATWVWGGIYSIYCIGMSGGGIRDYVCTTIWQRCILCIGDICYYNLAVSGDDTIIISSGSELVKLNRFFTLRENSGLEKFW